ncbi:MAG: UDP-2,3-diacylglucosamine hydrolase [Halieaceae bacterium]|jgi:UDP-2,3-diacylglucosamine hydrolase
MSAARLFISDLHLDAVRPAVIKAFADFLHAHRDVAALYILGDLFESWVGDDDDSALAKQIARMLRSYSSAGPALYLMQGNRDFMLGERFATRVGAQLLPDPSVVEIDGERLLLMHGDSLCTRDEDYQAFRKLARSPQWQAEMLAQSLEARRELAEKLRSVSRDAGSRKAEDIMDVSDRAVTNAMHEADSATLIHGHTHRPARHENSAGVRWVLGDWDQNGWYIKTADGKIELMEFAIPQ